MRKGLWFLSLLVSLFASSLSAAGTAVLLDVSGPIGPATQDYIQRGIASAEKQHADAVVIQLNTPGGLDTSMRGINEAIIGSSVPVITYVYPAGSRAASAGLFILYASHIAAMAPGTNVGAASPINLVGTLTSPTDTKNQSVEDIKIMNDTAAYMRSIAELRGRNAAWGESAVRNEVSLSATEAKQLNVINVIASSYPDLFQKINGLTVNVHGQPIKMQTQSITLNPMPQDWRYQFLAFITDPNIAYLLILIAALGIFFEFSNPGMVLPGVAGIISLLLVLYAFQLMPVHYTGLLLILLGLSFMIFEVHVSSFGVVGIGGIIALIVGSIMIFDFHNAYYQLSWPLISLLIVLCVTFIFIVVRIVVQSQRHKPVSGQEGLIGSHGTVLSVTDNIIVVRVLGEIWDAQSTHPLHADEKIRVKHIHGLTLTVEPLDESKQKSGE